MGPKSRTERPRNTKIGTEVAHVTRDSDTTFKIKRSKVNLQGRGQFCRPPAQLVYTAAVAVGNVCVSAAHFAGATPSQARSLRSSKRKCLGILEQIFFIDRMHLLSSCQQHRSIDGWWLSWIAQEQSFITGYIDSTA